LQIANYKQQLLHSSKPAELPRQSVALAEPHLHIVSLEPAWSVEAIKRQGCGIIL